MLRGKAATLAAERVKVTDEAGNAIDVKAADRGAQRRRRRHARRPGRRARREGDIEVDDLSVDVAGTIESADEADEPTSGRGREAEDAEA